ncbi:hypothetical protein M9435_003184 [Picochlorum sp. BPE23]|nr:hypothetical protein M9435_003184 [Picochlorum sp. BPE23]
MDSFFSNSALVASKVAESYVKSMVLDEIESMDGFHQSDGTEADENAEELEFIEATGALVKGLHDFGVSMATSDISSGTLLLERALIPEINEEKKLYLLQDGRSKGAHSDKVMSSIQKSVANLTGMHVATLNILFKYFNSSDDINNAIYQDWGDRSAKIIGAYDWHLTNASNLQVDIWANTPRVYSPMDIPDIQRWAQSINIASNAYIKYFFDGSVNLAGIRDMPRQSSVLTVDFSTLLGPLFSMWLMHAILPLHLNSLVYEKELDLRIFQHINGLRPFAFYASKFVWCMGMYSIYMSCFVGFGFLLGVKMFTKNIISIQIAFFGLWGTVIISFGFLYASFFKDRRSGALSSVFYILIMGFLANVVLVLLIEQENDISANILQFFVPSFCAFRGLYELSQYAFLADQSGAHKGISWNTMAADNSMLLVLLAMLIQSLVIPLLALYSDYLMGNVDGIRRGYLFFLKRKSKQEASRVDGANSSSHAVQGKNSEDELEYYLGHLSGAELKGRTSRAKKKSSLAEYLGSYAHTSLEMPAAREDEDDTRENSKRLVQMLQRDPSLIQHYDFSVIYQAVQKYSEYDQLEIDLSLVIQDQECFAFLGAAPGSFKSTILKMTVGLVHQDQGTILVHGWDSRDKLPLNIPIGACWDTDILFHELTGLQNLKIFGMIKFGRRANLDAYIQNMIESLDLHSSIETRVAQYSGGMRRRLSLAIALLGLGDPNGPKVVFIDEPSAGMDPYSRKVLWRVLKEATKSVSVVISTNNILEAESCDRIAVLRKGEVAFLGSPQKMISRYGRFMWLTITVNTTGGRKQIIKCVRSTFEDAELVSEFGKTLKFALPLTANQTIDAVFRRMEKMKLGPKVDIADWSVSNLSLEDVYLNLLEDIE